MRPASLASLFDRRPLGGDVEAGPGGGEEDKGDNNNKPVVASGAARAALELGAWPGAHHTHVDSQLTHPLPANHPSAIKDKPAFPSAYSRLQDEEEGGGGGGGDGEPSQPNNPDGDKAKGKAKGKPHAIVERVAGVVPNTKDLLAAVTVFLAAVAGSMVYADTLFDTDKLRGHWAVVVQMCCLGVGCVGILLLFISRILPSPCQDLFPLPFFLPMVASLHEAIDSPHELYNTVVVLLLVTHLILGAVLWLSGKGRLLRVADFIPYPVVCGLLGGLGMALVRMTINLVLRETEMIAVRMTCAVLFAIAFTYATNHHSHILLPLLFVLVPATLHAVTAATGASREDWLYQRELNTRVSVDVFVVSFDFAAVHWRLLVAMWPSVMALTAMFVLRTAMLFPAFERVMNRKVKVKREMRKFGIAIGAVGAMGLIPGIIGPGLLGMLIQITGVRRRAGALVTLLFLLSALTPFLALLLAVLPKFMFLGLPLANGFILLDQWVIQSRRKLPPKEWAMVLAIVVVGMLSSLVISVCVGAVFAVFLFAVSVHHVGCIKVHASALTVRSAVDRMLEEKDYLDQHGDRIQVIQLQGFLFFGNAVTIVSHIESTFPRLPPFSLDPNNPNAKRAKDSNLQASLAPRNANPATPRKLPPSFLVFDMPFVLGLDASAAEVLAQVKDIPCLANCTVVFSVWEPDIIKSLLLRPEFDASQIHEDIDTALEWCEEKVLRPVESIHRQMAMRQAELGDKGGFGRFLRLAEAKFGSVAAELVELDHYVTPIELQKGEVLMNQPAGTRIDMKRGGLFFIEHGSITIQRDHQQSLTLQSKLLELKGNRVQHRVQARNFRLTRVGAGWVIGATELCSGFRSVGTYVAECPTRVYYLPFSTVNKLSIEKPALALRLYRMLAKLVTEKADRNTEQLSHLMDWLYAHPSQLKREKIKGIV